MREAAFLKANAKKWENYEQRMRAGEVDPDVIATMYVELTDDLAYARSYYPESDTVAYLNQLVAGMHQRVYKNRKESGNRFVTFWTIELPETLAANLRFLAYAFAVFTISVMIGALSARYDDEYVRLILGDGYVNMTLDNIERGDPMAVYKGSSQTEMFLVITLNNIKVSFMTFVAGVLSSLGTGFILFQNGVMLGAFQYFFYEKDLLATSVLTIWIHGTLEISAIIIAGAAGMLMGNGLLFPGTYSRMVSFRKAARTSIKIIMGLVPVFIMAGFLEGFATRHTEWPVFVKLLIIGFSALSVLLYFVVYPIYLKKKHAIPKN